ncbi:MAG: alpha/beta hydrolase [Planctomycetota bacterium]
MFRSAAFALLSIAFISTASWSVEPSNPIVIVHGAWGGSHHWKSVEQEIESETSHPVTRVSLTGLGPKQHLLSRDIKLETHIKDVMNVIEFEGLDNVIIIGHSYGGAVVRGVVDRLPQLIDQVFYLDSHLLNDGESFFSHHPERKLEAEKLAAQKGEGYFLPVTWPNETIRDTPHPLATLLDPIKLQDDGASSVKGQFWLFADGKPAEHDSRFMYLTRAKQQGLEARVFAWGHNPHRKRPTELAAELIKTISAK